MSIRYTTAEPRCAEHRLLCAAAQLRRPVDDLDRIARSGSPIVLSAWDGPRLIGILRGGATARRRVRL